MFPTVINESEDVEVIEYGKGEQYKNLAVSAHRSGALRMWDTTRQVRRYQNKKIRARTGFLVQSQFLCV